MVGRRRGLSGAPPFPATPFTPPGGTSEVFVWKKVAILACLSWSIGRCLARHPAPNLASPIRSPRFLIRQALGCLRPKLSARFLG